MNPILFSIFLFLLAAVNSGQAQSQTTDHLYRVVYVKGKPVRQGKKPIRDGQKIFDSEKVAFSSVNDVVILLNQNFDKIRMKPINGADLRKLIRVQDFVYASHSQPSIYKTRGMARIYQFQSIKDTLKLHLIRDLNRTGETILKNFILLDRFMESREGFMQIAGEYLLIFPPRPGIYSLYFSNRKGQSEVITELEFMDKEELNAELKYVENSAAHRDSVSSQQMRYILKLYPNVPEDQLASLVLVKR